MKQLLRHYYQRLDRYGQMMFVEKFPATAYAKDETDLVNLISEGVEKGYIKLDSDMITVTRAGKDFMDEASTTLRKPTVFLSYNWKSADIVDEIEKQLMPSAEVKRDKSSVEEWGDLTDFMRSIRDQDFAVLVISDEYLKSEGCMFEVTELMKEQNWDERVMYVVTDDARSIYKTEEHFKYITFWENKAKMLDAAIREHDPTNVIAQSMELKKVNQIKQSIGEFIDKVKRTKNPGMKYAIDAIVNRVRGKETNPAETTVLLVADEFEDRIIENSKAGEVNDTSEIEAYLNVPEKLREGWNFHGDIAITLEYIARRTFGDHDRPYTKIYDADAIEGGMFAEVMMDVLRERTDRENDREDVDEFIRICSRFISKGAYEMDHRVAQALLDKFEELIGE